MTTAQEIVDKWLAKVKKDLEANYLRLGLKASGNWPKALEPFTERTNDGLRLGMLGEEYTGAIENGRNPNRDQSEEGLKAWVGWAGSTFLDQWVKDKDLDSILSPFAVAWKIALTGWEVPNPHNAGGLVSDVLTRERTNELNRELSAYYVGEIKTEMINNLSNGKI